MKCKKLCFFLSLSVNNVFSVFKYSILQIAELDLSSNNTLMQKVHCYLRKVFHSERPVNYLKIFHTCSFPAFKEIFQNVIIDISNVINIIITRKAIKQRNLKKRKLIQSNTNFLFDFACISHNHSSRLKTPSIQSNNK